MLNSILNGSSRTGSSTTSRNNLTSVSSSSSSSGYYQGRSGSAADNAVPPSKSGISVVEKKGDNAITVHANGNDYRIENKTAQEFSDETKGYSSAEKEEYAKILSDNQPATNTRGGTPPPTDTGGGTPPPTDTGGTTTEEESDNTLMYILIAAIVGVALFPTGKKKKK